MFVAWKKVQRWVNIYGSTGGGNSGKRDIQMESGWGGVARGRGGVVERVEFMREWEVEMEAENTWRGPGERPLQGW